MMPSKVLVKYPITNRVFDYMKKKYFFYQNTYNMILDNYSDRHFAFCEEILGLLREKCKTEEKFVDSLDAFIKLSHEYLLLQNKLENDEKYIYSSFGEINDKVYQDGTVMENYYLDGMLLSQVLWPNHCRMCQYFIGLNYLTGPSSCILDVPSGAGIYTYLAVKHFKFNALLSVDISPYAKKYTENILKNSGMDKSNIFLETADISVMDNEKKYDLIVCGELLEHVENPRDLLAKLNTILKEDGAIFLTTAVYAAAIDHIYLFDNVDEVRHILSEVFHVSGELILPLSGIGYEPDMDKVPINYACLLKKRIPA
jgi:2-polyprenyl-3-methyl-5-hydroxy-6-metoxy-1,4-benzoquinol methylase